MNKPLFEKKSLSPIIKQKMKKDEDDIVGLKLKR